MSDKREQILDRLLAVANVAGVQTALRNVTEFDDTQLPAVAVLEGDEEVDEGDIGRGRPSNRVLIVTALPQVYIRADSASVGTTLNTLRRSIVKAVLADSELRSLSLNDRGVRYNGLQSTLHVARTMVGATALVFAITYAFNPFES